MGLTRAQLDDGLRQLGLLVALERVEQLQAGGPEQLALLASAESNGRRAFRRLARRLHPDVNGGDKAKGERYLLLDGCLSALVRWKPEQGCPPWSHACPRAAQAFPWRPRDDSPFSDAVKRASERFREAEVRRQAERIHRSLANAAAEAYLQASQRASGESDKHRIVGVDGTVFYLSVSRAREG